MFLIPVVGFDMPSTPNRLIGEKSPYLLQHAYNPVDWFPWGEEAFQKARNEQKPIFLSIGYSTCHWCHVMERESFENPDTAEILNRYFVSIKVDREERPDVDRVYMMFVQSTTGSGGWPMSIFLTSDLQPFFGGTYYPPDDRYGRPGFSTLLRRLAEIWHSAPDRVIQQGENTTQAIQKRLEELQNIPPGPLNPVWLENAYRQFASNFDSEQGGFSVAPKFPRPSVFNFLLRYWQLSKNQTSLEMVEFTLRKMAEGGIHDHLGGGFHRYSVDQRWHVPHFEKMLYDQAQLVVSYCGAYQATGDGEFASVAHDILEYVLRDLTAPDGGFYSAEDADSLPSAHGTEKTEGAFYVWTQSDLDAALASDESLAFRRMFGVESGGNVDTASDPHGELRGKNVLFKAQPVRTIAKLIGKTEPETVRLVESARKKLRSVRDRRPRPHLDDKIVTAWNGLMISGLSRAAQIFHEVHYLQAAQRAARFLQQNLYDRRLLRSFRMTAGAVNGFAE
ncbi:MAG: thioredoxin domain-containing protein, partial [Verrucomicrobia bacterium]|nr:thioredoxin domain-containing protein [Verrucomicrobiota bacterium]